MYDHSRFSRQLRFPHIGESGQTKLWNSHVTIVGMGALGSVLANHMVRSGVGRLRIIDRDFVERSNLQRQILYDEADAEEHLPKVVAAKKKLQAIHSRAVIDPVIADLNAGNAEELLQGTDLILDGTDNFRSRYVINEVAVKYGIPWIYGGAVSAKGMFFVIRPGQTPCLSCLFESAPASSDKETCDIVGVIGPVVDIVASYQAVEALKLLVGDIAHSNTHMEHFYVWDNARTRTDIGSARNPSCPVCAHRRFSHLAASDSAYETTVMCSDTIQITPTGDKSVDLDELEKRLRSVGRVKRNPFMLRLYLDGRMLAVFADRRVLIQGIRDVAEAEQLYAKYIGI